MMKQVWRFLTNHRKATLLLLIFYAVGIAGMVFDTSRPLFISLIPFALLLSVFLLIINHKGSKNKRILIISTILYLTGFFVEVLGVNTGLIFGNYSYGSGLGLKVFNTPLMIGINWVLLIYTSASFLQSLRWKSPAIILVGASMMLIYDLILEQVAPVMDMWTWSGPGVPIQNYISWWLIAALMHLLVATNRLNLKNKLALPVFLIQFIFFTLIFIFIR
jgi:putative membrane protein